MTPRAPASRDAVVRIERFNRRRSPALVARKYAEMRASEFAFFRGTCHLFYQDWPARTRLNRSPLAWVSGDLHPENFGSYRGRDGRVYFDVDDFDEAALGPCAWDVARCATGIMVGAAALGITEEDAAALARRYLYAYAATIGGGIPVTIDIGDAPGMVRELLAGVERRAPDETVKRRTERSATARRIVRDGEHAAPARPEDVQRAQRIVAALNAQRKRRARFDALDVAERIAGTGSLGVARYLVLAARKGALQLLDIKAEPAASNAALSHASAEPWPDAAERVVAVQHRAQVSPPKLLEAIAADGGSYVVKLLQPYDDRVRWQRWHGRLERLEPLMSAMGAVSASSHLRCAGWHGAASTKRLAALGADRDWPTAIAAYARAYARTVADDYARFAKAYDDGELRARG